MPASPPVSRSRRDLCPGVFRPWPAADGALVRLRLVGGRLPARSLAGLVRVAGQYGDGDIHLTGRANLQLRGLPAAAGGLPEQVVAAIEATGLLPSRSHELVRNVMVSPLTGLVGGRADLRPVADRLDAELCSDDALAELPGRFLFVLDDGRGDLVGRPTDLGLVALDATTGQLRLGPTGWGATVRLADAARALADLAHEFLRVRGAGTSSPWHVDELPHHLAPIAPPDPAVCAASAELPFGHVGVGHHHEVSRGRLTSDQAHRLLDQAAGGDLVVTPWHGIVVVA